jgi:cholesterol transport system auxiliary component
MRPALQDASITMFLIAAHERLSGIKPRFFTWILALGAATVAGCGSLPDKPLRPTSFDLGPPAAVAVAPGAPASAQASQTVLVLPEIEAPTALDGPAVWYRLAYANAQQPTPYAQARWTMPPAQLLHQRLKARLGADRPVLTGVESAPAGAWVLRIELEDFSQVFASASVSQGNVRLRATLLQWQQGTERFAAQQAFVVQKPAPTPDAAGGAAALAAAADDVATQLAAWVSARR